MSDAASQQSDGDAPQPTDGPTSAAPARTGAVRAVQRAERPLRPALGAAYLAASWTWVIGMFFPVLLTGDFGWWAWLVFALPNVIGAASVGLLLRKPGAAKRFADKHRFATGWFSAVTIAFHIYAVAWLVRLVLGGRNADLLPGLFRDLSVTLGMSSFFVLTAAFAFLPFRIAARAAVVVLAVSVACFALAALGLWVDPMGSAGFSLPPAPEPLTPALIALAWIAPVIVAGFLLCPYLDLTINRVRQETAEPGGSYAFAGGFGGPFLLMILGTLGYAGYFATHGSLPLIIILHVVVQAAFTTGVHIRAVFAGDLLRVGPRAAQRRRFRTGRRPLAAWRVFLAVFLLLAMGPLGNAAIDFGNVAGRTGYSFARLGYETFMLMYGVVFPLAMWCFAIRPAWLGSATASRRRVAFIVGVALGLPLVSAGYLFEDWYLATVGLLAGGVASVLTAVGSRAASPGHAQPDHHASA